MTPSSRAATNAARPHGVPTNFADALAQAAGDEERIDTVARWILNEFDHYYFESRGIPALAKRAFETRDPPTSLALSRRRLSIYSISIAELAARLREVFPQVVTDERTWELIETRYLSFIEGRYEADLAFAYIHSVRRKVHQGEWRPVEYSFSDEHGGGADFPAEVVKVFPLEGRLTPATVGEILHIPEFATPYRAAKSDARLIADRIDNVVGGAGLLRVEMLNAGFYRNRGAYLVGRIVCRDAGAVPLIIALLNDEGGIYVDAVLSSEADAHNIFSSTLANFHVTNAHYHELSSFLHSIIATRPLGLHYSTIGFNHVGKVAVMNELKNELVTTGEHFETAAGFRGTVAIGFASPSSAYNLKVIRDKPTAQYKWGEFPGIDAVLRKYARVHEINRTGSMLDNIIYYNLKLEQDWFDPALLDELLEQAGESVSAHGRAVIFKHLIVQRRQTPLPVFLSTASPADAQTAVVNLGYCIKNNAAANIFNKDLDARNYGVSRFLKVFLFDYDALEPFTEVKIRTNRDRVDGEEDVPDWYFEDGVVFLPEEIETGLQFPSRALRQVFREAHGNLLTTQYWESIQEDLRGGRVPGVRSYPEERKLRRG